MEGISEVYKFAIAMVSIINTIGALPVFLSLTKSSSDDELKITARTCAMAIFVTIFVSMFFGNNILHFFGITIAAFRVGGGILIGSMAFNMLKAQNSEHKMNEKEIIRSKEEMKEMGIVPLGIPLLAGPGSISTAIIYSDKFQHTYQWIGAVLGLSLIAIFIYLVLSFSRKISQRMGRIGVNVMTRIMGLILMALAVEFITLGVKVLFPSLS